MKQTSIDITLVAGRRPELLQQTLVSFRARLFSHFDIARFIVNIDPFGGQALEYDKCVSIIKSMFKEAEITSPETACFGLAVKNLWQNSSADCLFHLEDDWLIREDVYPHLVFPLLNKKTKMITMMNENKPWKRNYKYHCRRTKVPFLSYRFHNMSKPLFSTSPCFIDGEFARKCGEIMNPGLDPEKQFFNGMNRALSDYSDRYRNRFLTGKKDVCIIEDIGRNWRSSRGIEKVLESGVSIWVSASDTTENSN